MEIRPKPIELDKIVPFVLGCYPFGNKISEQESKEILFRFVEWGFNTIDVAPNYGGGKVYEIIKNETLKNRNKLFLFIKIGVNKDKTVDNSYSNLSFQVEDALTRLNTHYLDSIILHWPDNKLSTETQISNLHKLKNEYPINYIGLSNWELADINVYNKDIDILHISYQALLNLKGTKILDFKKIFIYSVYDKGLLYKYYNHGQIINHTKNLISNYDGIIFGISKLSQLKYNMEIYDFLR